MESEEGIRLARASRSVLWWSTTDSLGLEGAVVRAPFAQVTLFLALGTSLATASAGLSMALGAFLAGLLVAETEYSIQVPRLCNRFFFCTRQQNPPTS